MYRRRAASFEDLGCVTVAMEVRAMPATARATEPLAEVVPLEKQIRDGHTNSTSNAAVNPDPNSTIGCRPKKTSSWLRSSKGKHPRPRAAQVLSARHGLKVHILPALGFIRQQHTPFRPTFAPPNGHRGAWQPQAPHEPAGAVLRGRTAFKYQPAPIFRGTGL